MKIRTKTRSRFTATLQWALAVAVLIGSGWPASGDDKGLLSSEAEPPYVFILLDTTGSMTWNVGEAELPFLRSDSPDSKMYQAKDALYQVVSNLDNIQFGFSTFNQDNLRVRRKHWMYETIEDGIVILEDENGDPLWVYPALGDQHTFGRTQDCDLNRSPDFERTGCEVALPADLDDEWDARRMQMYSKLHTDGTNPTAFYIRAGNHLNTDWRFEVTFDDVDVVYGRNQIEVEVHIRGVNNSNTFDETKTITFQLVDGGEDGFVSLDFGSANISTPSNPNGRQRFFSFADHFATGTCNGWEGNDDEDADSYQGSSESTAINLKVLTDTAAYPAAQASRRYGDVIPLNWEDDNKTQILDRLAPNRLLLADPGDADLPSFVPDFRVAPFLTDVASDNKLDLIPALRAAAGTVIMPRGSTPLGDTLSSFETWFDEWSELASNGATGDSAWGCRNVYVLLLTDGLETCGGDGPSVAETLFDSGVLTYVVGFGVAASAGDDVLDEIADEGGTGDPFRPQNVDELVTTLEDIFSEIREEASTFASAAVPSVQANVSDKIFLTSFTPIGDASVWDGHIDAYLKPLPVRDDLTPDRDRRCGANDESACLAWDAGEELVAQSLTEGELDAAALPGGDIDPIGGAVDLRRVLFSPGVPSSTVPQPRREFWVDGDSSDSEWSDMLFSLGFAASTPPDAADKAKGQEALIGALKIKNETITIQDSNGDDVDQELTYVLGDIFHSDPLVLSNPNDFTLFNTDFNSNAKPCDDATDPNPGYRCYFEKHIYRRKMLFVGSNDGQLHAFDVGIYDGNEEEFDNGTGREIFSFIPRGTLGHVADLAAMGAEHDYGLDGPLVQADVFIDPSHNGTPTDTDREWRSTLVGTLREGGRSVFAIDVTQPDVLGPNNGPNAPDNAPDNVPVPLTGTDGLVSNYVPSCWEGGANCGPSPFPALLWEFMDTADLDENGLADLGDTWSTPTVGLIKVDNGGDIEDRWVAVFGGGIDPGALEADTPGQSYGPEGTNPDVADRPGVVGNWIYMVDMETGQAIYKRRVDGAVPSALSVVDTNRDLYLDTIYFGTTSGFLYKINLAGDPPDLATLANPSDEDEYDIWRPFKVFDTGGRPIFYPPAVINVAETGQFALAFGTGYREDLWLAPEGVEGKFYMLLDQDYSIGNLAAPLTELALTEVALDDPQDSSNLLQSDGGWYLTLRNGERQIATAFAISGVTIFTSYKPNVPAPIGDDEGCSRTGESRIYIVLTTNANSVRKDPVTDDFSKFLSISEFVTNSYVELSVTKNKPPEAGDDGPPRTDDEIDDDLRQVMNELKGLFPDVCRFANYTLNLKTTRAGTGQVFVAPIPICVVQHNWREL
ncbi:MAG: hypothetical protein K0U98_09950 [Deltaproteobacteria bacterium]|nr:hypothetical protein [Deltaproteobacteria bacterium]